MKDDVAVEVKNVSKSFKLPTNKAGSIKTVFTNITKITSFKGYETQKALENINFDVKKGEFFGIVGRNGSGKSTLLKMLAGIYQPTKGSIKTQGKIVPFIELGVGFNPELSGRDNVFLNGALLGFTGKEIEEKYSSIVEFAELERFMNQKLKNYSSGMQVRLAFSVATILADSDILLLDEVLAVGDADFQRKCFDYFKTLKKNKKTVVFVSHDMSAVREYCDNAILVDNSKIIARGTAGDVASDYIRLFNSDNSETNGTSHKKRWGNQKINYVNANLNLSSKVIKISTRFQSNDDNDLKPIFGFRIKSSDGRPLLGASSKTLKRTAKYESQGVIEWTVANVLSTGTYTVDLAISHEDELTQYDWWEDAIKFKHINQYESPYVISPEIQIVINGK